MAQALLPKDLWSLIAPHLPAHRRSPKCGRPRINDRATLTGILFVLKTGIPWEYLPRELGCGSGMTCWRPFTNGCKQVFGSASMRRCCGAFANMTRSCGTERASTLQACQHRLVASIPAGTQLIVENSAANTICWWINVAYL